MTNTWVGTKICLPATFRHKSQGGPHDVSCQHRVGCPCPLRLRLRPRPSRRRALAANLHRSRPSGHHQPGFWFRWPHTCGLRERPHRLLPCEVPQRFRTRMRGRRYIQDAQAFRRPREKRQARRRAPRKDALRRQYPRGEHSRPGTGGRERSRPDARGRARSSPQPSSASPISSCGRGMRAREARRPGRASAWAGFAASNSAQRPADRRSTSFSLESLRQPTGGTAYRGLRKRRRSAGGGPPQWRASLA